ncbi:MAG: IS5 family transposase [Isosphaeraceae bacterium]
MRRYEISDEPWNRIEHLLPGREGDPGVTAKENRWFVNAMLGIAKTGAPWRDRPERLGNWNSVWRRFDRWARKGVWERLFRELQDPDLEWLRLESTVIRAHQHAAGAKKGVPREDQNEKRWADPGAVFPRRSPCPSGVWAGLWKSD